MKIKNIFAMLLVMFIGITVFTACGNKVSVTVDITTGGTISCTVDNEVVLQKVSRTSSIKVDKNKSVTLTAFANNGYNFDGWYKDGQLYSDNTEISFLANDDRVYSPLFIASYYDVSFNLNGGLTNEGSAVISASNVNVNDVMVLPNVSKDGYKFAGWYVGETKYVSGERFTACENIELVAKFYQERTVTFDPNGGSINGANTIVSKKMYCEEEFNIATPIKTGYEFDGWLNTDGSIYSYNTLVEDKNLALTASYSKIYSVTFVSSDPNEVNGDEFNNVFVAKNDQLDLSIFKISRVGQKFNGWEFDGVIYDTVFILSADSNVILTANFSNQYVISYVVVEADQRVGVNSVLDTTIWNGEEFGEKNLPTPTPTMTIHDELNDAYPDFSYWTYKNEIVTEDTVFNYNQNITLVAQWDLIHLYINPESGIDGMDIDVDNNGFPFVVNGIYVRPTQVLNTVIYYRGTGTNPGDDQGIISDRILKNAAQHECLTFSRFATRKTKIATSDFALTAEQYCEKYSLNVENSKINYKYDDNGAPIIHDQTGELPGDPYYEQLDEGAYDDAEIILYAVWENLGF